MKDQKWSREELEAAVRSYLEMRKKDLDGKKYVKKEYYQKLSEKFSRTEKSFEYRIPPELVFFHKPYWHQEYPFPYSFYLLPQIQSLKKYKQFVIYIADNIQQH